MNHALALLLAKGVLGTGLVGRPRGHTARHSSRRTRRGVDAYAYKVGDDNADGIVMEDESGFDCRVMGNLRCGPGATLPGGSLAIPGDYSNPNCWPGATYCPPSDSPPDWTATDGEGNPVPPLAVGPNALDAGTYVGEYN